MLTVIVGLPGNGKSFTTANIIFSRLKRYERLYKKTGIVRKVYSNLLFSKSVEKRYGMFIEYWSDPVELINLQDVDIVWDEISNHLDSAQWKDTPVQLKSWFRQHDKVGIDIIANTQDFGSVDISARRVAEKVLHAFKVIGSRRPSNTRPPVKTVWGLVLLRSVRRKSYTAETVDYMYSSPLFFDLLNARTLSRKTVEIFDTRQKINKGKLPPLQHIVRECEDDGCSFKRISHV